MGGERGSEGARQFFAARLRELRDASGLTQKSAADRAKPRGPRPAPKISDRLISSWERGNHRPSQEAMMALVRVLIKAARGRRVRPDDVSAGLLDEAKWLKWWREAGAESPATAGTERESPSAAPADAAVRAALAVDRMQAQCDAADAFDRAASEVLRDARMAAAERAGLPESWPSVEEALNALDRTGPEEVLEAAHHVRLLLSLLPQLAACCAAIPLLNADERAALDQVAIAARWADGDINEHVRMAEERAHEAMECVRRMEGDFLWVHLREGRLPEDLGSRYRSAQSAAQKEHCGSFDRWFVCSSTTAAESEPSSTCRASGARTGAGDSGLNCRQTAHPHPRRGGGRIHLGPRRPLLPLNRRSGRTGDHDRTPATGHPSRLPPQVRLRPTKHLRLLPRQYGRRATLLRRRAARRVEQHPWQHDL